MLLKLAQRLTQQKIELNVILTQITLKSEFTVYLIHPPNPFHFSLTL